MLYKIFFNVIFITLISTSWAASDVYTFQNSEQQQRFYTLTKELRCLVCQNQSLSESNAPLANDLRTIIANKINVGMNDQQIIQFLVERYGDFILYQPPLNKSTYVLWFGPFLLLGLGFLLLGYFIIKKQRAKT